MNYFDDNKNCEKAWIAFKNFSEYQVDCDDDAFLWQAGTYNFTGTDEFHYDIVRQFSHNDEDGEYDHMEQLHLTFYFEPNEVLLELEGNVWSYDFDNVNEFFNHVESLDSFKIPPLRFVPKRFIIADTLMRFL